MTRRPSEQRDRGFTLVEMLIVIVVLGVLATITVFAIRGITGQSNETACATELNNLVTAEEVHFTISGGYGDEASLLSSGVIKATSSRYDVAADADGYTITATAGAPCTGGATGGNSSGGGGTPPGPTPPVVAMGATESHHGVTAWRYPDGNQGSAADQILVFGGAGGKADWVAADAANIATSRRVHFFDIAGLTSGDIDTVLDAADTSGVTTVVVFTDDDIGVLSGGTFVAAYIQAEIGSYNATDYVAAQFGGGQLAALLGST
jgi:prepilin-type N-terminal cleavage/methylation domain-containing protein